MCQPACSRTLRRFPQYADSAVLAIPLWCNGIQVRWRTTRTTLAGGVLESGQARGGPRGLVLLHPVESRIPSGLEVLPGGVDLLIRANDVLAALHELVEAGGIADGEA